jgi:hypothetical protein
MRYCGIERLKEPVENFVGRADPDRVERALDYRNQWNFGTFTG